MTEEDPPCAHPDCDKASDFDSPNHLCAEHWDTWMEWPADEPDPEWATRKPKG